MSSRKLTRQQQWRIDKVQEERNARALRKDERLAANQQEGLATEAQQGLITAHFGRQVEVEAIDGALKGQRQRCHVRANVENLVTGDYVSWRANQNPVEEGVVESRQDRRSLLARPDMRGVMKPIAANVDQLLLVIAPEPEPHANLIDRYLVAAEHTGIEPVLVINKWDLMEQGVLTAEREALIKDLLATYQHLGYQVLISSAYQEKDLQQLQQQLKDRISVFVGQSGVGKSSLINYLLPGVDLRVGSLSEDTRKGRHTTTTARLFHFPLGGQLIDSPGIREFSLGYLQPEQIAQGFTEFRPFLGLCRFRDCKHQQDPGCALKAAVAEGKIAETRFASYHHLVHSLVH